VNDNHSGEKSPSLIKRIWFSLLARFRTAPGKEVARDRGKVKWFNRSKGYGFIARQNGPDVFVHFSAVDGDGERSLQEGQLVEFEVVKSEKGLQARRVRKI